jgi:hypothetical protein
VWEVGKCENRRQMPFMISIYLLPDSPSPSFRPHHSRSAPVPGGSIACPMNNNQQKKGFIRDFSPYFP